MWWHSPALGCPISHLWGLGGSLASSPGSRKEIPWEAAIGAGQTEHQHGHPQLLSPSFASTEGSSALAAGAPHVLWLFCCCAEPIRTSCFSFISLWGFPAPVRCRGACALGSQRTGLNWPPWSGERCRGLWWVGGPTGSRREVLSPGVWARGGFLCLALIRHALTGFYSGNVRKGMEPMPV